MSESLPPIDPQALDNLRALSPGDDDAFVKEICGIFVEDTPRRLTELDEGVKSGDVSSVVRAAHSIKGSSANLGAQNLRTAAEQLETKARKEGVTNLATPIAAVKAEFEKAKAELVRLFPR